MQFLSGVKKEKWSQRSCPRLSAYRRGSVLFSGSKALHSPAVDADVELQCHNDQACSTLIASEPGYVDAVSLHSRHFGMLAVDSSCAFASCVRQRWRARALLSLKSLLRSCFGDGSTRRPEARFARRWRVELCKTPVLLTPPTLQSHSSNLFKQLPYPTQLSAASTSNLVPVILACSLLLLRLAAVTFSAAFSLRRRALLGVRVLQTRRCSTLSQSVRGKEYRTNRCF